MMSMKSGPGLKEAAALADGLESTAYRADHIQRLLSAGVATLECVKARIKQNVPELRQSSLTSY
jgi:hypothetical protein